MKTGNLTRSAIINELLRAMKKMEAPRRGKPFMARRSFTPKQFRVPLREPREPGGWPVAGFVRGVSAAPDYGAIQHGKVTAARTKALLPVP